MLSYTQRGRRWWRVLTELDPSMALSDGLRLELIELPDLSRQEVLVVKACAATKDFEGVAKYSGIHLREGYNLGRSHSHPAIVWEVWKRVWRFQGIAK